MTDLHIGVSHAVNQFFASKFLVCFQRRPGPGDSKVITDLGSGRLQVLGGAEREIRAVNGIYALPLQVGDTGTFEVIGIRYNVAMCEGSAWQSAGSANIVGWHGELAGIDKLTGVQQRLQILGYYTGRVDNRNGRLTERAVLEFQADEGSLLIDGVPGPLTQAKLDTYYREHAFFIGGPTPLLRRYLLSFKRAKTGPAEYLCPHPDYRGGDNTIVSYGTSKGFVFSWLMRFLGIEEGPSDRLFRVGMTWETPSSPPQSLYPVVADGKTDIVEPEEHSIAPDPGSPLALVGKLPGTVTVQMRYGDRNGPNIGELSVHIHQLKQVNVAVHILDVRTATDLAPTNKWNEELANRLVADVDGILAPAGVEFRVKSSHRHTFEGRNAGTITTHHADQSWEFMRIWASHNVRGRINVYFVNRLLSVRLGSGGNEERSTNALGFALSRRRAGRRTRIGVCVKHSEDTVQLAQTVAHEIGHMLNLTSHPNAHSDDDGTNTPFRHDIWSRTRLMAKYSQYSRTSPIRSWHDPGYGVDGGIINAGCLLTSKRLANDGTDDEIAIARRASNNPY